MCMYLCSRWAGACVAFVRHTPAAYAIASEFGWGISFRLKRTSMLPTSSDDSDGNAQITAEKEYATLCTFLETILTHIWCAMNVFWVVHPRAAAAMHKKQASHSRYLVVPQHATQVLKHQLQALYSLPHGFPQVPHHGCNAEPAGEGHHRSGLRT